MYNNYGIKSNLRLYVILHFDKYEGSALGNLKVLCPFHDEKTPSCSIDDYCFYCFGCQKTGSVFDFVMAHSGIGFKEAVELLGGYFNGGGDKIFVPTAEYFKQIKESAIKREREREQARVAAAASPNRCISSALYTNYFLTLPLVSQDNDGGKYLFNRQVYNKTYCPSFHDLRWDAKNQSIVGLIRNSSRLVPMSFFKIFVDNSKPDKKFRQDIPAPKKFEYGYDTKGGGLLLYDITKPSRYENVYIVGEGLESTLKACSKLYGAYENIKIIASLSTAMMANILPPPEYNRSGLIIVFADNDYVENVNRNHGVDSAKHLANYWRGTYGYFTKIIRAEKVGFGAKCKADWADDEVELMSADDLIYLIKDNKIK